MAGPLHGLRAIDLTDALGHLCRAGARRPRRRGDQVEPPGGDPSRRLPPRHRAPDGREHGLYWYATNAGKRGVTLALDRGREVLAQLLATADFVLESLP